MQDDAEHDCLKIGIADSACRGRRRLSQVTFEIAAHKEATMSFKKERQPRFGQA